MSRRKQRAREAGGAAREPGGAAREPGGAARVGGRAAGSQWGLGFQIAFAVAVFALAVLVAELAGAANLGVSFGIGEIAFAIAVAYLLIRR
jgi:hypothetical protein